MMGRSAKAGAKAAKKALKNSQEVFGATPRGASGKSSAFLSERQFHQARARAQAQADVDLARMKKEMGMP